MKKRQLNQRPTILCISDGGKPALAFQTGAMLALYEMDLLRDLTVFCGSGSGNLFLGLLFDSFGIPAHGWSEWTEKCTNRHGGDPSFVSVDLKDSSSSSLKLSRLGRLSKEVKREYNSYEDPDNPHAKHLLSRADIDAPSPFLPTAVEDKAELNPDPLHTVFLERIRQYCTTNLELRMLWYRFAKPPWYWFNPSGSRDYSCSTLALLDEEQPRQSGNKHMRWDSSAATIADMNMQNQTTNYPIIVMVTSTTQRLTPLLAVDPEDARIPSRDLIHIVSNDVTHPSNSVQPNMQFASLDLSKPLLDSAVSLSCPAAFGPSTIATAGQAISCRSAEQLDPYAVESADIYYVKRRLGEGRRSDQLLLLDGFSHGKKYVNQPTALANVHAGVLRRLCVSPDEDGKGEFPTAFRKTIVRLSEFATAKPDMQAAVQQALDFDGLISIPDRLFKALVNWGFESAIRHLNRKHHLLDDDYQQPLSSATTDSKAPKRVFVPPYRL